MAEIPEGAELVGGETVRFPDRPHAQRLRPARRAGDLPRRSSRRSASGSGMQPIHLRNVFVSIGEGTLADYLNRLLGDFPLLQLGSYPEFSNPEYKVKVTLESQATAAMSSRLWPISWRDCRTTWSVRGDPTQVPRIPFGLALLAVGLMYLLGLGAAPFLDPPEGISRRRRPVARHLGRLAHPARGRRPLLRQAAAALLAHGGCLLDSRTDRSGRARCGPHCRRSAWRRSPGASASCSAARAWACWPGFWWRRTSGCSCSAAGQADLPFVPASCWPSPASSLAYRAAAAGASAVSTPPRPGRADQGLPRRDGPLAAVALFLWLTRERP